MRHHGDSSDATCQSLIISAHLLRWSSQRCGFGKFRLWSDRDALLLHLLRTPKVTGEVRRGVELFQKHANIFSQALISEHISAACSVCKRGEDIYTEMQTQGSCLRV